MSRTRAIMIDVAQKLGIALFGCFLGVAILCFLELAMSLVFGG